MSLCIVTPVFGGIESGSVSLQFHEALTAIRHAPGVALLDAISFMSADLVRCRSKALHIAHTRGFDHVLFWDSDVVAPPDQIVTCLRGMLASGYELVGAPYPRKREPSEPVAHEIVHAVRKGECHPCKYLGMGFTLIAMTLVDRIYAEMAKWPQWHRRNFKYEHGGRIITAPCAFMLTITDDDVLLSEDASFCERASRVGGRPWLYVGEGSNLGHVGSKVYR